MTTMDSDSESQDSDDGRRFRFEATRKDNAQLESKIRTKPSGPKSKDKTRYNDIDYKDRKDRSRHEGSRKEYRTSKDRDTDSKDLRHATKYSKHESRTSRHEDSYRDTRDTSLTSKNFGTPVQKHKTRDSKHQRNRDRSEHHKHRLEERSHNRTEDDRSSADKHKSKSHEKYKRHSRDRSRDRGYQSHKLKSADHSKSRGEHERHNSHKRTSTKGDESQHLKEHLSPKNTEQGRNESEPPSTRDLSVDSQDCKDLDLSEFDVLSETDENLSDDSDIRSQSSIPRHQKTKVKKRNSNDECETVVKKQAIESEQHLEEYQKVNSKRNDPLCGSSNNNPSAVSDSLLGTDMNDVSKRFKCETKEETIDNSNSKEESSDSVEEASLHFDSHDSSKEVSQPEEDTRSGSLTSLETTDSAYGPALPPTLLANSSDVSNTEKSPQPERQIGSMIDVKSAKTMTFIGPCLPQKETLKSEDDTVDRQNLMEEDFTEEKEEGEEEAFGPALPPHLMQQRRDTETEAKIIGPALPSTIKSSFDVESEARHTESEDEDAIGPLPVDHPALKSSHVYKQLEQRAQQLKNEQKGEDNSNLNQREEWMTELPPAQASNLGLGPRKFRLRAGPDMSDRSCWTDTPAKKAEKQRQREEEKLNNIKAPEPELPKESYETESGRSRKREKSLVEIHQSKLRKKKKKEEKEAKLTGQPVRRPFDRDIDLKANQFDQAQKNTILRKAQLLDERFSRGKI